MNKMKFHPAANLFLLIEGGEFDSFKADIAKNGLLQPIVIHEGQVLDGRNRYRACADLDIDCASVEYTGNSPIAHVWSLNGKRRHLSISQLAAIATNMLPALQKEAEKRQIATQAKPGEQVGSKVCADSRTPNDKGRSSGKAAAIVGVGSRTVDCTSSVKNHDPELFKKIESGEITANKAYKQIMDKSTNHKHKKSREQRYEEIRLLAADGHRAQQIADEIGISAQRVRTLARSGGIDLPDAKIGSRYIDATGIVERAVNGLAGFAASIKLIRNTDLKTPPELAADFVTELSDSLIEFNWLKNRMKEISI